MVCCLKHPSFYRFGKPFVTLFGDVRPAESHHQIPTQHIFSSLSSSECSHRLGGWMPQNNYPDPPRLSHPRWPAGCILSVSKLLCIHARGSDRDHRALGPSTNERSGNGELTNQKARECHQSVSGRLAIIALSLTEIDTNKDKKQSLHLGL